MLYSVVFLIVWSHYPSTIEDPVWKFEIDQRLQIDCKVLIHFLVHTALTSKLISEILCLGWCRWFAKTTSRGQNPRCSPIYARSCMTAVIGREMWCIKCYNYNLSPTTMGNSRVTCAFCKLYMYIANMKVIRQDRVNEYVACSNIILQWIHCKYKYYRWASISIMSSLITFNQFR